MSYTGGGRIVLNNQREAQISRFRTWVLLAVPLAAIFFQIYVPQFFHFLNFLEMPLLVVVYFALIPLMVSYKPQAGQTKIPAAASHMAGGQRLIPTRFLGRP